MRILLAIAIAAVLMLSACSDDGDASDDADETAPASAAAVDTTTTTTTTIDDAVPDPPATDGITTVAPSASASVRDALLAGGFASDQADCIIRSMTRELGVSESELDELAVSEQTAAEVSVAGDTATLTCLSPAEPSESGPGTASSVGPDGSVAEELSEMGYTAEEASCLGDMIVGDGGSDLTDCVSASRLVEIINS